MKTKVVHLHLKEPYNGESDFYFGSLKAIFDTIPHEAINISYKYLTNAIRDKDLFQNKRCTIRIGYLERKQQSKTTQQ